MNKLEFIKNELIKLRDNYDLDEYSYTQIDIALDHLDDVNLNDIAPHNYYIGFIMDEINDAIYRGDILENVSREQIYKIINLISKDDSMWDSFYSGLNQLFYDIKLGNIDIVTDDIKPNYNSIVKPIYFEK